MCQDRLHGWSLVFSVFNSNRKVTLHRLQGSLVSATLWGGDLMARSDGCSSQASAASPSFLPGSCWSRQASHNGAVPAALAKLSCLAASGEASRGPRGRKGARSPQQGRPLASPKQGRWGPAGSPSKVRKGTRPGQGCPFWAGRDGGWGRRQLPLCRLEKEVKVPGFLSSLTCVFHRGVSSFSVVQQTGSYTKSFLPYFPKISSHSKTRHSPTPPLSHLPAISQHPKTQQTKETNILKYFT